MSVDKHLIDKFSELVYHEAQQMTSRLRPYAELKRLDSDEFAVDNLGAVQDQEISGRNQAVSFTNPVWERRWISRRRFSVVLPVDSMDVEGSLTDPTNDYAKAVAKTANRRIDRIFAEAAFADVTEGRNKENTITFGSEGATAVDATGGLTYAKLLEIDENFIDEEVVGDRKFLTVVGGAHSDLMAESELTSGDYVRNFVVEQGRMTKAAGFDLVPFGASVTNPVLSKNSGGTEWELIAGIKGGICVGMGREIEIEIEKRPDLHDTWQVKATVILGAVRRDGNLIQKVRVSV